MAASSSSTLAGACASLSLDDDDSDPILIGDEGVCDLPENHNLVLVGRFATEKLIKFHAMRETMAATWRPGKGVNITEVTSNLFLFQFFHEVDVKRILEDGPWSFEQCLLVLEKLKPNVSPYNVPLKSAEFWVQAHNLPVNFFTHKVAEIIGGALGEFIMADKKNFEGSWKSFLRVIIRIDITLPLRRRMKMKRPSGEIFWIDFKFERLPNFCFLCGVIGHTERFCHLMFEGVNEETKRPFGPFLRATGRRPPVSFGSPWLVSDSSKTIPPVRSTEQDVGNPVSVHPETNRDVGVRARTPNVAGKNKAISGDIPETVGQKLKDTTKMGLYQTKLDDLYDGPVEVDQKRKRTDLSSEPNDTVMSLVCLDDEVSKNGFMAGPGSQARQSQ